MNRWNITGSESAFTIIKTDLATRKSEGFSAEHPMKLDKVMRYLAGEIYLGDIIVLPNGIPLVVSNRAAMA